ncbi:MAG: hypothetical protein IT429_17005 [Gemmataceae bacterium]|nr:hypothetical protein [Gemmataceae bacterium]
MNFTFVSPRTFESWGPANPDAVGIGNSETSVVEMSWRLTARGHDVVSHAPLPGPGHTWRGVRWRDLDEIDATRPGIWCLYRCPEFLDRLQPGRHGQRLWLICQDEDYRRQWTRERMAKLDRVVALCPDQAEQFRRRYPLLSGKVCTSSNGLKPELVRATLAENLPRNPRRLLYASSPDRALWQLIGIFGRAREFVPDLELAVAYGFDNIDKFLSKWEGRDDELHGPMKALLLHLRELRRQVTGGEIPGLVWLGRLPQPELYREWSRSGIWCYPCSNFRETSCATAMEAQALGAVPIVSPHWAVGENTLAGVQIEGDAQRDALTQSRFAAWIVRLATDPGEQERVRREAMPAALERFSWERFADQWQHWSRDPSADRGAVQADGLPLYQNQFDFQHAHSDGAILNVGCDADTSGFKARGAVNVDVWRHNPYTGMDVPADVLADARALPPDLYGRFDTVVLGDILEHYVDRSDVLRTLCNAELCLKPGGKIAITCPEDRRPPSAQVEDSRPIYTDGVLAFHAYPVTRQTIEGWLRDAGLEATAWGKIAYPFAPDGGWGVVAVPAGARTREPAVDELACLL